MKLRGSGWFLVGVMYTGEQEMNDCLSALAAQRHGKWDLFTINFMDERSAHNELYKTFMKNSESYQYFLKVDADMVLNGPNTLSEIDKFLRSTPNVDHACFSVKDYMSQMAILGMHVFTRRAEWILPVEQLYPDKSPEIPGRKVDVWVAPAPIATHAAKPSSVQAFRYGSHRALKALNPSNVHMAAFQSAVLDRVIKHKNWSMDIALRYALLGAWHAWQGDIPASAVNTEYSLEQELIGRYKGLSVDGLDRLIPNAWEKAVWRRAMVYGWLSWARKVVGTTHRVLRGAWLKR